MHSTKAIGGRMIVDDGDTVGVDVLRDNVDATCGEFAGMIDTGPAGAAPVRRAQHSTAHEKELPWIRM